MSYRKPATFPSEILARNQRSSSTLSLTVHLSIELFCGMDLVHRHNSEAAGNVWFGADLCFVMPELSMPRISYRKKLNKIKPTWPSKCSRYAFRHKLQT